MENREYSFVPCSVTEVSIFAEWHKEPSVRRWIYIDHWLEYFHAVKDDPLYFLFAVVDGNEVVAEIGAEKIETALHISLMVAPELQNKGIGTAVLRQFTRECNGMLSAPVLEVIGNIEPDNIGSKRCFERRGLFVKEPMTMAC